MTERILGLVAILMVGCSGGSSAQPEYPTLEPTAQSVAIPYAVMHDGMLLGGTPTEENLRQAKELGYKTVINLRTKSGVEEERALVESLGMTFVHIPVPVPEGLNGERARVLADALAKHEGFFIIHCKKGQRAAALVALKAGCVDGQSTDDALATGKRAGLEKLEPMVRSALPLRCVAQAEPEEP